MTKTPQYSPQPVAKGRRQEQYHVIVPEALQGVRVDQGLSRMLPAFSRSRIKQWINAGQVHINGRQCRPRSALAQGDRIDLVATLEPSSDDRPEAIPLAVVFADEHLLVLDKPPGLVVHPGAGNPDGTLVNGLLNFDATLGVLPRAGLVHRLDKDTSGLLVVARSLRAHRELVRALARRRIHREYLALVYGTVVAGGEVDVPIGRHRSQRTRMAVRTDGRVAKTYYRVAARYHGLTLLRVRLETGRTHQIRVHMAYVNHPIVGDPVYGGRQHLPSGLPPGARLALQQFRRQALHACHLAFAHPITGADLAFTTPLPPDMDALLAALPKERES